jgi:hypothetical protein
MPVVDVLPAMPVVDELEALPAAPPPLPADVLDVLPPAPVELEPDEELDEELEGPPEPVPPGLDSPHPASAPPHSSGNVTNRTVTNASFRMLHRS